MLKKYGSALIVSTAFFFVFGIFYRTFFDYNILLSPGESYSFKNYSVYLVIFVIWVFVAMFIIYKNRKETREINYKLDVKKGKKIDSKKIERVLEKKIEKKVKKKLESQLNNKFNKEIKNKLK